jgi:hypothetical protein
MDLKWQSAIRGQGEAHIRNADFYGLEHRRIFGMRPGKRFQALDSILLYRQPRATLEWALAFGSIGRVSD